MHALVFCGDGGGNGPPIAYTATAPRPRLADPLDAIVRVSCAGVCGSDLHCAWHCLEKGLANGSIVGHEAVGRVVALGEAAAKAAEAAPSPKLRLGDRVLVPFTASCGACAACSRGDTCRCASSQLFGWRSSTAAAASAGASAPATTGLHGCQAQYVRVPLAPSTLLRLPASAPDELGVLLGDILSTAFFCARQGGISPEATKTVAVVGCGPVGLLAVLAAKHESSGNARVVAIDGVAERRALALELGADAAVAPDLEQARRALAGGGAGDGGAAGAADVVLELVGGNSGRADGPLRLAFDLLRPAGVLASQGVHTGTEWPWTPVEAYDKNLTFRAGRCPARHMAAQLIGELFPGSSASGSGGDGGEKKGDEAAAAAADALIRKALRIITHKGLPLSQGVEAYDMFAARRDGCVKVTLDPFGGGDDGA
jgi:threonine dehydrogenase-like Zn-dependent dehydrogenase